MLQAYGVQGLGLESVALGARTPKHVHILCGYLEDTKPGINS